MMRLPPSPLPAADHAEAIASPITWYPFPASRTCIVPAGIPSVFFGTLQSSHRAFRAVIPRLSLGGPFYRPRRRGFLPGRGSYGSRLPALISDPTGGCSDRHAAALRCGALRSFISGESYIASGGVMTDL